MLNGYFWKKKLIYLIIEHVNKTFLFLRRLLMSVPRTLI